MYSIESHAYQSIVPTGLLSFALLVFLVLAAVSDGLYRRIPNRLVLGGLIKDASSSRKAGLPFLSAIPVLGALFGQHRDSAERTELLVILTPRVLRSDEDARAVSRELRERMRGLTLGQGGDSAPARP